MPQRISFVECICIGKHDNLSTGNRNGMIEPEGLTAPFVHPDQTDTAIPILRNDRIGLIR